VLCCVVLCCVVLCCFSDTIPAVGGCQSIGLFEIGGTEP